MTETSNRYERWHNAARALEARDELVTLRAVRKEAGGGSMTDVMLAMRAYRARHIPASAPAEALPESILKAVKEMYRLAEEHALKLVAEERASLATAAAEGRRLQDELSEVAFDVEAERDAALSELAETRRDRDMAMQKALVLQGRVDTLQELVDSRLTQGPARSRNRRNS